jgi:hypothetical protein
LPPNRPIRSRRRSQPLIFDRRNPEQTRFGKLLYRGGLNLYSPSPYFGGYSALAIDPAGGALLALSDAGFWLRADIDYDGSTPAGLSGAATGPLSGPSGEPLISDLERDAEALALISGDLQRGEIYVAFERKHRIERYAFDGKNFSPPEPGRTLPAEALQMEANRGIEALALIPAGPLEGTLIAFSEDHLDADGNIVAWLLGGPTPGRFSVKRLGGFDITDATVLPDGTIALLERRFRITERVQMRIRRLDPGEIAPGALIEGETLLEAGTAYNLDNMEGVAAHRGPAGETVLTVISDDNFNPLQRTLLMQFVLPDDAQAKMNDGSVE